MHTRPPFDPSGLPPTVVARAVSKAAASWCYVAPDGSTFYISEKKARQLLETNGGWLFAPTSHT